MEELKVKVVEVSQEKEQPQGTSMLYALILTKRDKYIFCRFCRKLNIFFIFLHITN